MTQVTATGEPMLDIAGEVPNTPRFLVQWVSVPQSIEPGTAMPNLGISDGQARDIVAYLYNLR